MNDGRSRTSAFTAVLALAAGLLSAPAVAALEVAELDRYVFVANRTSADIAVIDARSDQVVERLDLGTKPEGFLLSSSLGLLVARIPKSDASASSTWRASASSRSSRPASGRS